MGYLAKFNQLLKAMNADKTGDNTRGELALLLRKFDPAKLFDIEQAVEHSKSLLVDWLTKYKFKDWKQTETRGIAVTPDMKRQRAEQIATILGDAENWHSHGRGITMIDLQGDKIKLKVKDFAETNDLNQTVRHYHGLFTDYMSKLGWTSAIHTARGMRRVG
jgi:hypothetical protein